MAAVIRNASVLGEPLLSTAAAISAEVDRGRVVAFVTSACELDTAGILAVVGWETSLLWEASAASGPDPPFSNEAFAVRAVIISAASVIASFSGVLGYGRDKSTTFWAPVIKVPKASLAGSVRDAVAVF